VAESKHIFIARISQSALSSDRGWIEATFEVEETFKGEPAKVPSIKARFSDSNYRSPQGVWRSCPDLAISPGTRFIVFAADQSPAIYSWCTETRPLQKRDDPEVDQLRTSGTLR
jgi:hypothetical protein